MIKLNKWNKYDNGMDIMTKAGLSKQTAEDIAEFIILTGVGFCFADDNDLAIDGLADETGLDIIGVLLTGYAGNVHWDVMPVAQLGNRAIMLSSTVLHEDSMSESTIYPDQVH